MTESDKINGWTFEETVKTATNLMEVENNMFKWDVLRHLRDFAEMYEEEVQRYRVLGNVEELRHAKEKQIPKKPRKTDSYRGVLKRVYAYVCPTCGNVCLEKYMNERQNTMFCWDCGQKLDWSDKE